MVQHVEHREALPERRSHRHEQVDVDEIPDHMPRLGRRESEPHSEMINYIHDVLSTNYPSDRVTWDLHHFFPFDGETVDICYDISVFNNFSIPDMMSSYKASDFNNRVPDLAINILSKSTHDKDVGRIADLSILLGIPVYVVFASHDVGTRVYRPPFMRVYMHDATKAFTFQEIRKIALREEEPGSIDMQAWIDPGEAFKFTIGIMETRLTYTSPHRHVYRPVFMDKGSGQVLLSSAQHEKFRADKEKRRADEEKQRADEEKQRADEEKRRADEEKQRADESTRIAAQEKQRADELAAELDRINLARRQG